jgi:hypothetical protein
MTEEPEIVFEQKGDDAVTEVECDKLPFWVALTDSKGGFSHRLVRSWVFAYVHATPEVPLTASTLKYMESVTQWIINGPASASVLTTVEK